MKWQREVNERCDVNQIHSAELLQNENLMGVHKIFV